MHQLGDNARAFGVLALVALLPCAVRLARSAFDRWGEERRGGPSNRSDRNDDDGDGPGHGSDHDDDDDDDDDAGSNNGGGDGGAVPDNGSDGKGAPAPQVDDTLGLDSDDEDSDEFFTSWLDPYLLLSRGGFTKCSVDLTLGPRYITGGIAAALEPMAGVHVLHIESCWDGMVSFLARTQSVEVVASSRGDIRARRLAQKGSAFICSIHGKTCPGIAAAHRVIRVELSVVKSPVPESTHQKLANDGIVAVTDQMTPPRQQLDALPRSLAVLIVLLTRSLAFHAVQEPHDSASPSPLSELQRVNHVSTGLSQVADVAGRIICTTAALAASDGSSMVSSSW